jgi:geranylgeranyl diphosphate synthase type I
MSLPVVAALNSGTPEGARLAELYARPPDPEGPDEDELAEAAALVDAAGGRAWAEAEAGERIASAAAHLASAGLPEPVRAEFLHIAAFVTRRDH